ncbi:unnamed protein product [Toxocara canis]|uniref:Uncharacterized protein n=1 Tax=Toxocara canis TaxID=6265 RepID=A0A183UUQ4_TOXCA|nr:unnamed protein product [Toxocara canis]
MVGRLLDLLGGDDVYIRLLVAPCVRSFSESSIINVDVSRRMAIVRANADGDITKKVFLPEGGTLQFFI